ncbi:2084_t:CDS:1, partial [Acaulospora colombiana]
AVELRVEIPYRVNGAVSVVTHFEVLLLLLFLQGKMDYREGVVVMGKRSHRKHALEKR